MTDDTAPISYVGLGNLIQRMFGSAASFYPLADKPVAGVSSEEDGQRLVFRLVDGRALTYTAEGDCCSSSWIEHITVPPDIDGAVFTSFAELDGQEFKKDYDTIRVYQTAFQSPKGEVIVEYRNASNGYYGGWLDGPIEQWAKDEIRAAREATR